MKNDKSQKAEAQKAETQKAGTVEDFFGPVICSFSRQDALNDGMLADVSEMAREAGFRIPVAVTASVWEECIYWPEDEANGYGQSTDGRLWDVLFMAHCEIASARGNEQDLLYKLNVIPRGTKPENTGAIDDFTGAILTTLKINIGPGDNGEPVITIMQTYED